MKKEDKNRVLKTINSTILEGVELIESSDIVIREDKLEQFFDLTAQLTRLIRPLH